MDQSVTIDGQRVLLNGEPVAEALGDFSVLVVARGLSIYGKMLEMADKGNADAKNWLEYTGAVVRPGGTPEETTMVAGGLGRAIRPDHKITVDHATVRVFARATKWQGMTAGQIAVEPVPAPADLLVKAREYYPDNEGLLRMYADCRGYSCQQVEEAIDHAKRL